MGILDWIFGRKKKKDVKKQESSDESTSSEDFSDTTERITNLKPKVQTSEEPKEDVKAQENKDKIELVTNKEEEVSNVQKSISDLTTAEKRESIAKILQQDGNKLKITGSGASKGHGDSVAERLSKSLLQPKESVAIVNSLVSVDKNLVLSDPTVLTWKNKEAYVYTVESTDSAAPKADLEFVIYIPIDTAVHWLNDYRNDGKAIGSNELSGGRKKEGPNGDGDGDRTKGKSDSDGERKSKSENEKEKEKSKKKKEIDEDENEKERGKNKKRSGEKRTKTTESESDSSKSSKRKKKGSAKKNKKEAWKGIRHDSSPDDSVMGPDEDYFKHRKNDDNYRMKPHDVDFHHKVQKDSGEFGSVRV